MKDLTGKRFGRWHVLGFDRIDKHSNHYWFCVCKCGNKKSVSGKNLLRGRSKSCGCMAIENNTKHGMWKTPEYKTWQNIHTRCSNKNTEYYKNYGGRGIVVCKRWNSFENFFEDMGRRPSKNHSIERIDNDGNYEPGNCEWVTRTAQQHNNRIQKNNTSGERGIKWNPVNKNYVVRIGVNGKEKHVGCFSSIKEAKNARKEAEITYWDKGG